MRVIVRIVEHGVQRVLIAGSIVAGVAVAAQTPAADAAATVLAGTRQALGGEQKLAGVKSLVATGRTRQVRGENLVPIEFEIAIELPDRYVRKDEIPAQESGPTTSGFNGAELIQVPPPPAGQPDAARVARLAAVKQDFVRLTLGMFAASFSSYPLTFSYVAKAEAPEGKADVLAATGPDNFSARLFVSENTHLPILITWTPPSPAGRGPASAGPAEESRLFFADYRDVSGLKLPFRLRRAVGSDTVEETTFDNFKLNPKIDPKKFEVRR